MQFSSPNAKKWSMLSVDGGRTDVGSDDIGRGLMLPCCFVVGEGGAGGGDTESSVAANDDGIVNVNATVDGGLAALEVAAAPGLVEGTGIGAGRTGESDGFAGSTTGGRILARAMSMILTAGRWGATSVLS